MTIGGFLGVMAALAFVLGLLFLALRLIRHLPALARSGGEGPELRVLSRTGLSPRQGIATVQAGSRTLLVGYGEGGVRYIADMAPSDAAEDLGDGLPVHGGLADPHQTPATLDSATLPTLPGLLPTGSPPALARQGTEPDSTTTESPHRAAGLPFREALARAVRNAGVGFALALSLGALTGATDAAAAQIPGSVHAASATSTTLVAPAATFAFAPLPQQAGQDAPVAPAVEGVQRPEGVQAPGADFPSVEVTLGDGVGEDLRLSGPVGTVIFVGFLTLLPALLLLMTGFTRILVVLHLLKQAVGTQTAPPAQLLTAMALLLTGFVMAPTLQQANQTAVQPWMDGQIDEMQMLDSAAVPFRAFMLSSVRDSDLRSFVQMQPGPAPETVEEIPMTVLASAFVTSELRSAFQMGFALFLPFVIIDIVVASVLMSMGMFMLPPVMVSLPFKLLLFVMVDGWALVIGSLVRSFA